MSATIRPASPADADALLRLVRGLNEHLGGEPGRMTSEVLVRDLFCPEPKLAVAVAESAGAVVGYAAWCGAYETEHAMAGVYLIDLYVDPPARRRGIARRLMAAVAAAARARGRGFVWWTALPTNTEAAAFYASIASHSEFMVAHALFGERFEVLADEAGRDEAGGGEEVRAGPA